MAAVNMIFRKVVYFLDKCAEVVFKVKGKGDGRGQF